MTKNEKNKWKLAAPKGKKKKTPGAKLLLTKQEVLEGGLYKTL